MTENHDIRIAIPKHGMTGNEFSQAFRQNPDGSWSSIRPVKLKTPEVQVAVMIDTGMIFRPGERFLGVDIVALLNGSRGDGS